MALLRSKSCIMENVWMLENNRTSLSYHISVFHMYACWKFVKVQSIDSPSPTNSGYLFIDMVITAVFPKDPCHSFQSQHWQRNLRSGNQQLGSTNVLSEGHLVSIFRFREVNDVSEYRMEQITALMLSWGSFGNLNGIQWPDRVANMAVRSVISYDFALPWPTCKDAEVVCLKIVKLSSSRVLLN